MRPIGFSGVRYHTEGSGEHRRARWIVIDDAPGISTVGHGDGEDVFYRDLKNPTDEQRVLEATLNEAFAQLEPNRMRLHDPNRPLIQSLVELTASLSRPDADGTPGFLPEGAFTPITEWIQSRQIIGIDPRISAGRKEAIIFRSR